MTKKTILSLTALTVLLMGCAGADHYPITGQTVGIDDQVQFMVAPNVMPK